MFLRNFFTLTTMSSLKIKVGIHDSLKDVIQCIAQSNTQKIVFQCERGVVLFSDIAALKKIKQEAETHSVECVFITSQEFVRKILEFQKFTVFSSIEEYGEDTETPWMALSHWKEIHTKPKHVQEENKDESFPSIVQKEESNEDIQLDDEEGDSTVSSSFEVRTIDDDIKKPKRGIIFFLGVFLIALLVFLILWLSPRAVVFIKPEVSVVPLTQNFLIQLPLPDGVDTGTVLLPTIRGIYVENEVQETQTFPTTGKEYDLTNAYGSVTLYNETTSPKFLVPSRLSTTDGVIFRFSEEVTIPPKVGDTPGSIIVNVVADPYDADGNPIGHRGNIPAGTELFFPALRDDLREIFYGIANRGPLVGGSTLTHYFMADDDIAKTREFLEESFRHRALQKLKEEVEARSLREGKNYILLDHPALLQTEIIEESFPEELVGQAIETFDVYVNLKLQGIVFDQGEIIEFLKSKAEEVQDERKKLLYVDPVSANYAVLPTLELIVATNNTETEEQEAQPRKYVNEINQVKISVQMKGIEMYDFYASSLDSEEWRLSLKKEIAGRSRQEALGILTNFPEIENITDIHISPFWSQSIPLLLDQIEFVVQE